MVKFDQLIIEYNKRNIFLQSRKRRWETSARPLLVFQKSIKASGLKLECQYTSIALNLAYNKNKLFKTLDYWSSGMLCFNFLEKGLGIVSPPYFVYDFSRKMLVM